MPLHRQSPEATTSAFLVRLCFRLRRCLPSSCSQYSPLEQQRLQAATPLKWQRSNIIFAALCIITQAATPSMQQIPRAINVATPSTQQLSINLYAALPSKQHHHQCSNAEQAATPSTLQHPYNAATFWYSLSKFTKHKLLLSHCN